MSALDPSFDEFAAGHVRELLRTAYLICGSEADAEDLVQECLWRVARRWRKVRSMRYPAAYARQIVVNLAIDRNRKHAGTRAFADLRPSVSDGSEGVAYEPVDDRAEREIDAVISRADLMAALQALPGQQRAAVVLRYFNDLSEADTAKVLGCGVGTVKSQTARGLARMREHLDSTADSEQHEKLRPRAVDHE